MFPQSNRSPAELLALLPDSEREKILAETTEKEAAAAEYTWRGWWARPNQLQPEGQWRYWLALAGRGWGKTKTGAETIREWARERLPAPIHLVAPTAGDIRRVMIEGPSGLLSCYPPAHRPMYEPSNGHKITWANGNIAFGFSADEPERLRGPQCCRFWADELAAWRFAQDAWDNLMFGFRIGDDLRGVITTTPKPVPLVKYLAAHPSARVTRGSTYENRAHLSAGFYEDVVRPYEGTRLGRQELLAEILEDIEGALWKRQMIDATRIRQTEIVWECITRIVVAVDPAVSKNGTHGIVVVALTISQHVLVMDDLSMQGSPDEWARVVIGAYITRKADRIVGEVNNGGDLVERNIRTTKGGETAAFRAVHATRGKQKRAEPVAALYEQGRVHHVGCFAALEDQMCVVKGSMVPTMRGHFPVEDIRAGDFVLTRIGWCRVKWAGRTGQSPTILLVTKRGNRLRCTPGHPIWAANRFRPCIEVQKGYTLLTCHTQSRASSLSFRGKGIFETHAMATSRPAALAGGFCSIDQSGKRYTVQSLPGGMYTTSITTEETTPQKTWKRSRHVSTKESTGARALGQSRQRLDPNVSSNGGVPSNAMRSNVKNAGSGSWCEAIGRDFAEDTVENVIVSAFPEEVYNLTVEEQPEYFASGILVHNCEYVPGDEDEGKSPDRMDALVWGITELLIDTTQTQAIQVTQGYHISNI